MGLVCCFFFAGSKALHSVSAISRPLGLGGCSLRALSHYHPHPVLVAFESKRLASSPSNPLCSRDWRGGLVSTPFASSRLASSSAPLHSNDGRRQDAGISGDGDDELAHRKHYSISGTGRRSAVEMKTSTGHVIKTDVPKKMGGADAAAQPVETLLAALIGCTQATAVYVGRMMSPRLVIEGVDFNIEAYRDERGALARPMTEVPTTPARLQRVSGTVRVHFREGAVVTDEQLRALGEQTEARCPVANMMHASGCEMDIRWTNGSDEP